MSMMKQMRSQPLTPRTALVSIVLFVVATAGVMAMVVKMVSGASGGSASHARPSRPTASVAGKATLIAAKTTAPANAKPDYSVIVARNLFQVKAVVTEKVAPPPPVKIGKPAPPPAKSIFKPTIVNSVAPFQVKNDAKPQLALTGVVDIAGTTYALLESLEDHKTQYTRPGSAAFGYTLVSVAEKSATMEANGATFVLNIGENKEEVKLERPATATPQPNQPGAAPGPGTGGPGMGGPGAGFRGNFGGGNAFGGRRQRGQNSGEG